MHDNFELSCCREDPADDDEIKMMGDTHRKAVATLLVDELPARCLCRTQEYVRKFENHDENIRTAVALGRLSQDPLTQISLLFTEDGGARARLLGLHPQQVC